MSAASHKLVSEYGSNHFVVSQMSNVTFEIEGFV